MFDLQLRTFLIFIAEKVTFDGVFFSLISNHYEFRLQEKKVLT